MNLTVISGNDLDEMSDDQLFEQVKSIGVYARVSPEHKMRIIAAWKRHGDIVAMTGDGVNDAPALKKADIGAAMGIVGTEVAKSAADMVLTDDNFATVVAAVEEGRRIRDNITKAISYLLSCNAGELFVLLLAVVLNWPLPLLAIHISLD
jgi:P-type Ca2+ transporter type 2C